MMSPLDSDDMDQPTCSSSAKQHNLSLHQDTKASAEEVAAGGKASTSSGNSINDGAIAESSRNGLSSLEVPVAPAHPDSKSPHTSSNSNGSSSKPKFKQSKSSMKSQKKPPKSNSTKSRDRGQKRKRPPSKKSTKKLSPLKFHRFGCSPPESEDSDWNPDSDSEPVPKPRPKRPRRAPAAASAGAAAGSTGAAAGGGAEVGGQNGAAPDDQGVWGCRLPLEVLHQVFAEVARPDGAVPALLRLARVCRLWRDAALSPHLWRSVDLGRVVKAKRTEARLSWLLKHRLTHVQELSLAGWDRAVTPAQLSAVCRGCPELRALGLAHCRRVSPELLLQVARQAPRLRALDLAGVQPASSAALSLQSVRELTQLMAGRLTALSIAQNRVRGLRQLVNVLANNCPCLEELDLSNITTESTVIEVEPLMEACPKLKALRWSNSGIKLASNKLDAEVAARGFPALEELSVAQLRDGAAGLDDRQLYRLLCGSARLRLLDIRGCGGVTSEGLDRLPAADLQHLYLGRSGVLASPYGASHLLGRWRHSLRELDFSWAGHQTVVDAALRELARPDDERWPPPPLRRLDLSGSPGSLVTVRLVLAACPALRELELTSCRAMPRGLKRLFRGDELEELRDELFGR